jgi:hypothetical protein
MPQGGKEGHRLPVAVGGFGLEPLSAQAPSAQRRHIGLGPALIDEDEYARPSCARTFLFSSILDYGTDGIALKG